MNELQIDIYSFGFQRSGMPEDVTDNNGGFVFDCRFLPNPGRYIQFAKQSGLDAAVKEYIENQMQTHDFLAHVFAIVDAAVASYREQGYTHLQVSFGCTGGQHRSVFCAERLAAHLLEANLRVSVTHTEKHYWS
jgi:RNase adaptor protein for sRNA GlmZ degradation